MLEQPERSKGAKTTPKKKKQQQKNVNDDAARARVMNWSLLNDEKSSLILGKHQRNR
jgi:hypothetical protein